MPRTAIKTVKEGEMTPFRQDAYEVAGGMETPAEKGCNDDGWAIAGSSRRQSICGQLTSPKGIANTMGLHNPTPPQTDSDSGTGSSSKNRFAVLQEDGDSKATTDVVHTDVKLSHCVV